MTRNSGLGYAQCENSLRTTNASIPLLYGAVMSTGTKRRVVISLCLISVCGALGVFSSAADAAAQPFGRVGALSSAADAQPFGASGVLTSPAQAGPDPSLVGYWDVTGECSGSPCYDTIDISIGGQPSDPACSANAYCITTESGFYGIDVSLTPTVRERGPTRATVAPARRTSA
jgi:hypothetical protein